MADPQHNQTIEVTHHLRRFGGVTDFRLDIRQRLGVGRDLDPRAAPFINQRNELVPH